MPFIHTKRNYVCVGNPLEQDRVVATYIQRVARTLLVVQPINKYKEAVDWAVSMADYMEGPLEIVTAESEDLLVRQHIVATAFEGVFANDDPSMQRKSRNLLVDMGVLHE